MINLFIWLAIGFISIYLFQKLEVYPGGETLEDCFENFKTLTIKELVICIMLAPLGVLAAAFLMIFFFFTCIIDDKLEFKNPNNFLDHDIFDIFKK